MAFTRASLIEFVRSELLACSHRALSVASNRSVRLAMGTVRELSHDLFRAKVLASFIDLESVVHLAAGLEDILERLLEGETIRTRKIDDLIIRILRYISEAAQAIGESSAQRGGRSDARRLETEILRTLRAGSVASVAKPLPITANGVSPAALQEALDESELEDRFVSFSVVDLLQAGEDLFDFIPLLEMLSERRLLLGCGVLKPPARRAAAEELRGLETVYYLILGSQSPTDGLGALTRLPVHRVTELVRPVDSATETSAESPPLPQITIARIDSALSGGGIAGAGAGEDDGLATGTTFPEFSASSQGEGAKSKRPTKRRSISIGFKLITIISLLILVSLSTMIVLASLFFRSDATVQIEENNHTISSVTAEGVAGNFQSIVAAAQLFLTVQARIPGNTTAHAGITQLFFQQNPNLLYVGVRGAKEYFNDGYLAANALTHAAINRVLTASSGSITNAEGGVSSVENLTAELDTPTMGVFLPYRNGSKETSLVIISSLSRLLQSVQSQGITQTFVVNASGKLIADPNLTLLSGNIDYSTLPIVREMLASPIDNGETQYTNSKGVRFLGSFKKVGFAGLGVVSTAPVTKAFAAVAQIQRRNLYLMIIVLSIAVLIVYFFSKTITLPIRRLVEAARQIERGHFHIDLKPKSGDEVGRLTESFVEMGRGLSERERMKDAFGKFVNKSVAEQVLSDEIRLGGERREATIFFSDIRSFTAISEKLQPEQVVEFLNEYMTLMVECVNQTDGVVDKFIGDAIMAVWGVPIAHDNDAEAAVNTALLMREALEDFNRDRGGTSKPIIRIGCGINSGHVLAGQIGSTERMEYTVIGDPVNLASRIEALNKPFGTDILITEDTYTRVKETFAVEPQLKIKVKGKTKPQQVYAVLGRLDDDNRPRSVEDLQRRLGVNPAELAKRAKAQEEEVKYEILED